MSTEKTTTERKQALELVTSKRKDIKSENVLRCLTFVRSEIGFDKSWKTADLAEHLKCPPNSIQFGHAMSEINRALERDGYHLTTRGKNGLAYYVESIDRSSRTVALMNQDAIGTLKRAAIFANGVLTNHGDKLSESQRNRLERQAEISALRAILASRVR